MSGIAVGYVKSGGDGSGVNAKGGYGALTAGLRSLTNWKQDIINVLDYGVKGDAVAGAHTITNASGTPNVVNIAGQAFVATDVGKYITIYGIGAGGLPLSTTIAGVNSGTSITLTAAASTFITSSQNFIYGTDDGPAISLALRQTVTQANWVMQTGTNAMVLFPQRTYMIATTINATNLQWTTLQANGATFYGVTNGQPVIDALGCYGCKFEDFFIVGDQVAPPNLGMWIGRYLTSGRAFGLNAISDVQMLGYFSLAGLDVLASEASHFTRVSIANSFVGSVYAFINDGNYHFNLTSQYVTINLTQGVAVTNTINLYSQCRFTVGGTGALAAMWISSSYGHTYHRCYAETATGTTAIIILAGSAVRAVNLYMDFSVEGTSLTSMIYFQDDGTHVTSCSGLTLVCPGENSTNAVFNQDNTFTLIKLLSLDYQSNGIPSGSALFLATPALYSVTLKDAAFGVAETWVVPTQGMVGTVMDVNGMRVYGLLTPLGIGGGSVTNGYIAAGFTSAANGTKSFAYGDNSLAGFYGDFVEANGTFGNNGTAQRRRVTLRGVTTSTTPVRLTANGSAAGSTNIFNLGLNTSASCRIKITAIDTTTRDTAVWYVVPTTNPTPGYEILARIGAGPSAYTIADTPICVAGTNTGGGSLTGAGVPTIVADVTNGGLNITVTATGTNTVNWTASIHADIVGN